MGRARLLRQIQAAPDERERDETRGEADEEDGLRQLRHVPAAAEVVGVGAVLPNVLEGREPLPPRPPAQPYRAALRPLPEESWRVKVAGGWLKHPRQWLGALWAGSDPQDQDQILRVLSSPELSVSPSRRKPGSGSANCPVLTKLRRQ